MFSPGATGRQGESGMNIDCMARTWLGNDRTRSANKMKMPVDNIPPETIFRAPMCKKFLFLLLLLASGGGAAQAAPPAARPASRMLILENSTMPLPTARATLIIGPLTRTKSDRGRLAINIPDEALAAADQGKTVSFSGTSTSAKNGIVRRIEITATPMDRDHGTVRLWFMAGDQKMIFTPAYHFEVAVTARALTPALAASRR